MITPSLRRFGIDVPAHLLATATGLDEQHAALLTRGVHQREGGWVIACPSEVVAALTSPALRVSTAHPRHGTPARGAGRLQATMARFSDGEQHARRRALLEQLLPAAAGLQDAASQHTTAAVHARTDAFDVMPLARTMAVMALAAAISVPQDRVHAVTDLVERICEALAPRLDLSPISLGDGDQAAEELTEVLAALGPWDEEQVGAAAGLLFQARDATAALIGGALLTGPAAPGLDIEANIDSALRRDAPVQCTRRTAADDLSIGPARIPRGAPVWVVLAAADQGPPSQPATFGAGPHACPGSAHAVTLARGMLSALRDDGWQLVPDQPVSYEPRPNLRLPASVLLQRA